MTKTTRKKAPATPRATKRVASEFRALATTVPSKPGAAATTTRRKASVTTKRAATGKKPIKAPESDRTTITFYLSETLRNRARAAFRATRTDEGDLSWSDMVTKALLTEVERREREHNGGEAFAGSAERLQPGRPITP